MRKLITVLGSESSCAASMLAGLLTAAGRGTVLITPARCGKLGSGADYWIMDLSGPEALFGLEPDVVILKENARFRRFGDCYARMHSLIVPSGMPPLILPCPQVQLISCGTGERDAVSLSSMQGGLFSVCFQRTLRACSGRLLEPMEFPVVGGGAAPYDMMAALTATLLLLEKISTLCYV